MDINVIIGLVLTGVGGIVFGAIATVVGARITREKPGLRWWTQYAHGLQRGPIARPHVQVEGHDAEHLVIAHLTWENSGDVPLQDVPFTWRETRGGQLVERAADPPDRVAWGEGEHGTITLLNPGEMVCCDLVYINAEQIEVQPEARAPGVTAKPYHMGGGRLILHLGRIFTIQVLFAVAAVLLALLFGLDLTVGVLVAGIMTGVAFALTLSHYWRAHRRRKRNREVSA